MALVATKYIVVEHAELDSFEVDLREPRDFGKTAEEKKVDWCGKLPREWCGSLYLRIQRIFCVVYLSCSLASSLHASRQWR